ncbi:hypothetical protein LEMLEM_LOCUS25090 [Lemmus lemmus]
MNRSAMRTWNPEISTWHGLTNRNFPALSFAEDLGSVLSAYLRRTTACDPSFRRTTACDPSFRCSNALFWPP